jgi:hypothetical protein
MADTILINGSNVPIVVESKFAKIRNQLLQTLKILSKTRFITKSGMSAEFMFVENFQL